MMRKNLLFQQLYSPSSATEQALLALSLVVLTFLSQGIFLHFCADGAHFSQACVSTTHSSCSLTCEHDNPLAKLPAMSWQKPENRHCSCTHSPLFHCQRAPKLPWNKECELDDWLVLLNIAPLDFLLFTPKQDSSHQHYHSPVIFSNIPKLTCQLLI